MTGNEQGLKPGSIKKDPAISDGIINYQVYRIIFSSVVQEKGAVFHQFG
jgi:hypothetical protein